MSTIGIYVLVLLFIFGTSISLRGIKINNQTVDRIVAKLSLLLLSLVGGLRAPVIGTDTANYIVGFNMISRYDYPMFLDAVRWESGYVLFNKLISLISDNNQAIIIATSISIVYMIIKYIARYSSNVMMSIYLFITLYYYFVSFNAIRQFMAIGIFCFGIRYVYERKIVKYISVVMLASLFHQTALLYLPLYFLYGVKLNFKNTLIVVIGALIVIGGFDYYFRFAVNLFPDYQVYYGTKYFEGSGILTTLISGSILLYGIFAKLSTKTDTEFDFLIIIMIITFIISFLSTKISVFNRLLYNYSFFSIIFIPKALSLFRTRVNKTVMYLLVLVVPFMYFVIRLIEGWHRVTPYEFFW